MIRQYSKYLFLILIFFIFNCSKDYESLYKEAITLKNQGKYDQSLEKFKEASEKKETPEVYKEIANYYIEYTRDYDIAEKFLKKSLNLNEGYPNAIHNMGLVYLKKYEESLETNPQSEYLKTAKNWFTKNIKLNPEFALSYAEYGMVLFYEKDFNGGLKNITLAMDKGVNKSYAHLLMGKIYFLGFKKYDEALKNFNIAYNDFSNDSYLLKMLALTYNNLNDLDQAHQFYKRYLKNLEESGAPEPLIKKAKEEESKLGAS